MPFLFNYRKASYLINNDTEGGEIMKEQDSIKYTKKYIVLTLIGAIMMAISLLILDTGFGPIIFGLGAAICFSPAILSIKEL